MRYNEFMKPNPALQIWIQKHTNSIPCACGCGSYIVPKRDTYYRYKKGQRKFFIAGHQMRRENHGKWKGGIVEAKGYIWIRIPDHHKATPRGYVKRAHLVAEKTLGRQLRSEEVTHHVDGNRLNDSPKNIKVLNRIDHLSLHYSTFQRGNDGRFLKA